MGWILMVYFLIGVTCGLLVLALDFGLWP